VLPELRLALCADLPMHVQFLSGGGFVLGPLFGFGAEYFLGDPALSLGLSIRFGPVFFPTNSKAESDLGFVSQATLAYRL
jgi:hypothetical protein